MSDGEATAEGVTISEAARRLSLFERQVRRMIAEQNDVNPNPKVTRGLSMKTRKPFDTTGVTILGIVVAAMMVFGGMVGLAARH